MADQQRRTRRIQPLEATAGLADQQERDLITVAKGGGISFAGTAVTRIINYLYSMVLVWGLGGESFGLYTLALAIVNFIGVVAELGLGLSIIRFGAIHDERGESGVHRVTVTALLICMPVSLILLVAMYFGAEPIAVGIFHKAELIELLRLLAWSVPLLALQSLLTAAIRTRKQIQYSASVMAIQAISAFVLAILFMALGFGMNAVAISYIISHVLGATLSILFYLRVVPRQGSLQLYPVQQMLKFSVPLTLTKWIQFANERTEVIFLGLLPTAVYVGIYKIAWSLAGLETMLRLSLEEILAPFSSSMTHKKELKQLDALYKTTAKWSFTWALFLASAYLLFGVTLMKFFDPGFAVGAFVLVALSFAQLFNEATGACGTILIMSGRSDLSLLNTVVLFGTSATLDWILIPRYGLPAAAFVGTLGIVLVNTLRVLQVWALLKIHPFAWSFLKPALAGAIAVGAIWGAQHFLSTDRLLAMLLFGVAFACIYLAVILLLGLDSEDMLILNAVRRRVFGRLAGPQGA